MAMDAGGLQDGFRVGEWLVEPGEQRVSGPGGKTVLPAPQMQVLLCLAEHHGESVDRLTLRSRAWPGQASSDEKLRAVITALRELFGETSGHTRYIVPVGHDGYALIAHYEPLPRPLPALSEAVDGGSVPRSTFVGRLQRLIEELRRRHVFRVTASYLVGMWIILQVAEVTFAPLRLPDWWITALTILAVLGLPIIVVLSWSYEITPGGIVLDESDAGSSVHLPKARWSIAPAMVAGVALMSAVTGFAWWRAIQALPADVAPVLDRGATSIAVLPLVDMSPAGRNAYLGDGLSEELSTRLAQVPGLRVAARTSAFEFKDKSLDVRTIGQSLGVTHVLEGSVRRDGDKLRVTVQLIDARTGFHIWAGSFDRGWREVIEVQDDIARAITAALKIVLNPGAVDQRARESSVDARAFDPYLAGLALLRQSGDMSRMKEAEARFEETLRIAPSFARAHAGLCEVLVHQYDRTRDRRGLARAEDSCKRALELDASLVETEKALASLYVSGGRFSAAEAIYRRMVVRVPRDADVYIGLGRALEGEGRIVEAERSFRQGVAVEPAFWSAHNALGGFLFEHGKIDEAVAAYRRVAELTPASGSAYNNLGAALQMKGDLIGSAQAFERSLQIEPSRSAYSNLGTVDYYLGQFAAAAENYAKATALADQDQALWGNYADALWQLPARRPEAVGYYRRAIALAADDLAEAPDNARLSAQLAYYHGRIGNRETSLQYLRRASSSPRPDVYVQYYAALSAADRGDVAAARRAVDEARKLGYPDLLLAADPALASLGLRAKAGADGG